MDSMVDFGTILSLASIAISVFEVVGSILVSLLFLVENYGLGGIVLWLFGSGAIWRMQKQVLESEGEKVSMDFKASMQNESSMIAVAGSILAQIAITALSLSNLSQAHWVARAFFTFGLVSSIMAVYYASDQYRILGRHLRSDEIKAWIRNVKGAKSSSMAKLFDRNLRERKFLPSAAAVLTISAPNMLLPASLNSLLLGLGVYLGYVWTRNLDGSAGVNSSRAVFITYVVSLTLCYGIYALSGLVVARQSYKNFEFWHPLLGERRGETASQGHNQRLSENSPMERLPPGMASETQSIQQRARGRDGQASLSARNATQVELIKALQEAAKLRRDSAAADERIAQLYERLSQQ